MIQGVKKKEITMETSLLEGLFVELQILISLTTYLPLTVMCNLSSPNPRVMRKLCRQEEGCEQGFWKP